MRVRWPGWLFALLLAFSACLAAPEAEAQSARALRRARILFARGVRQFDRGQVRPALRSFTMAYQAAPAPAVVYNIAQCHLSLGHDADAARHFRLYLEQVPDAPNRDEVERHLRQLDARIAAVRRQESREMIAEVRLEQQRISRGETLDEERPESGRGAAIGLPTWITLGAGLALAGTGVLFWWDAVAKQSDLDDPSLDCHRAVQRCIDLVDGGDRSATLRTVLLSAGGAALVAGFVMLAVDLGDDGDRATLALSPWIGNELRGLVVRGAW